MYGTSLHSTNYQVWTFRRWFVCVCMSVGSYMMVVGQLESPGHRPVIHAMKLHNLSSYILLQTLWPLEVRDVRLHAN